MSIGIDWGVLLAPLIVKLVEALVAAILKWLESQPAEKAVETLGKLAKALADFQAGNKDLPAVANLMQWGKGVMA